MTLRSRSTALLASVAPFIAGCGASHPNRSPVGETFPTVGGEGLDGKAWSLPGDLAGQPAILLVGYKQNAQFDLDRWMLGLLQAGTPAPFYEIPTIEGLVPGMFAESIDDGMRGGIPKENWGGVITVYKDASKITRLTGTQKGTNGRVLLLDRDGTIVWFHDRGYSPTVLLELDAKVRSLPSGAAE